jgi:hypothetical protein
MKKITFRIALIIFIANISLSNYVNAQSVDSATWNCFTGKYDLDYSDGQDDYSGNLSLRMKKDSILWFSISAVLGIQILKGKITIDSAFILDLYSKKYYSLAIQDLSKLQSIMPVAANLRSLQELFLGGKIVKDYTFTDSMGLAFRGLPPNGNLHGKIENSQIKEYVVKNKGGKDNFQINYEKRLGKDEYYVPEVMVVRSESDSKIVRLNFSLKSASFEVIPSYPFAIPKDYKNETIGF